VLSTLQKIYQTENAPPAAKTVGNGSSGPVSSYVTSQLASYSLALSMFGGAGDSSTVGSF
jgi:hypothetical protein